MKPMFLPDVENKTGSGPYEAMIEKMKAAGATIPQIFHMIRYKPSVGQHLSRLTQEIMRGPSPLSAGQRELIAAFTSSRNQCPF
ncbi:MAG: peroxidase [Acidobacteriia bacterium]|nr:peroxidase [Terriglobia bacterium]